MEKQQIKIKNKDLYESLFSLTNKSLKILCNNIKTDLVVRMESEWCKREDGNFMRQDVSKPVWAIIFHKAKSEISQTKEYQDFSEIVKSDDVISSHLNTLVGTCMGASRFGIDNILSDAIYTFLSDTKILGFDKSLFDDKYSKIENSLYSDEIEFIRITPLCGFSANIDEIPLGEGISIAELSDSEIIEFLRLGIKMGDNFGNENFIYNVHQFAIKISYNLPKIIGEQKAKTRIEEHSSFVSKNVEQFILDALRIYKEGTILPLNTVSKNKGLFIGGTSWGYATPVRPFMKNKYQLQDTERGGFVSFWGERNDVSISDKHFLSVAIRRFSQANEREDIEDRIIDLLICAESLFLSSDGIQGELKYRLSHRAAMFIEKNIEKQKIIFNFMKKAYDVRSAIVHGSTPKLPKKDDDSEYTLDEFCSDIEKHLRFSLKKAINMMSNPQAPKKIEWESIIFPLDDID